MTVICNKCDTAHDPKESCEEAARRSEAFAQRVRRHLEGCDHCRSFEDAYWFLLRKENQGRSKIIRKGMR